MNHSLISQIQQIGTGAVFILFLMGVMLIATPDGLEIVNLSASILMAAALIPYGIQLIAAAA